MVLRFAALDLAAIVIASCDQGHVGNVGAAWLRNESSPRPAQRFTNAPITP